MKKIFQMISKEEIFQMISSIKNSNEEIKYTDTYIYGILAKIRRSK